MEYGRDLQESRWRLLLRDEFNPAKVDYAKLARVIPENRDLLRDILHR